MTRITRAICATGALLSLTALATMAYADGRDYNDGPVQTVTFIRTVDGHFDDYMHWLATTYKKQQEAAKAAGLITRYEVLVAQPHNPQDADVILVTEFKNWAALDHLGGKLDQVSAKIEGSVEKAQSVRGGSRQDSHCAGFGHRASGGAEIRGPIPAGVPTGDRRALWLPLHFEYARHPHAMDSRTGTREHQGSRIRYA